MKYLLVQRESGNRDCNYRLSAWSLTLMTPSGIQNRYDLLCCIFFSVSVYRGCTCPSSAILSWVYMASDFSFLAHRFLDGSQTHDEQMMKILVITQALELVGGPGD